MDNLTIRIVTPTTAQRLNAARVAVQYEMGRTLRTLCARVLRELRQAFAPFVVLDDYGTHQRCWTRREAMTWLPYCAGRVSVVFLPRAMVVLSRDTSQS